LTTNDKIQHVISVFLTSTGIVFVLWLLRLLYRKFCRGKNQKYNQFGKTPLTNDEKAFIQRWQFHIPDS